MTGGRIICGPILLRKMMEALLLRLRHSKIHQCFEHLQRLTALLSVRRMLLRLLTALLCRYCPSPLVFKEQQYPNILALFFFLR
jgi:hypothetical protein